MFKTYKCWRCGAIITPKPIPISGLAPHLSPNVSLNPVRFNPLGPTTLGSQINESLNWIPAAHGLCPRCGARLALQ